MKKVNLYNALRQNRQICLGAFGLGIFVFGGIGLQQTALVYTNVANAAFLTALYVPLVPLIAALFLRRHVALNIWPAVVISYLLATITSLITATAYTEFAIQIPVTGSAYNYIALTFGEYIAFITVIILKYGVTEYNGFLETLYDAGTSLKLKLRF